MNRLMKLGASLLFGACILMLASCTEETGDVLPDQVRRAVESAYPGAKITEVDKDDGNWKVDIVHEGQELEIELRPDGSVVSSETD